MPTKFERQKPDFCLIKTVLAKDPKISANAKGIYYVLSTLPDGEDFSLDAVCELIKEGRTGLYAGLRELELANYCGVWSDGEGNISSINFY